MDVKVGKKLPAQTAGSAGLEKAAEQLSGGNLKGALDTLRQAGLSQGQQAGLEVIASRLAETSDSIGINRIKWLLLKVTSKPQLLELVAQKTPFSVPSHTEVAGKLPLTEEQRRSVLKAVAKGESGKAIGLLQSTSGLTSPQRGLLDQLELAQDVRDIQAGLSLVSFEVELDQQQLVVARLIALTNPSVDASQFEAAPPPSKAPSLDGSVQVASAEAAPAPRNLGWESE